MEYYSFNTTKKYTKGLLDTFNDIFVERTDSVSGTIQYKNVPLVFGSKDAAFVFTDEDNAKIKSGNLNFLPRMSISLNSIVKKNETTTNRLHKINKKVNGDIISFQQNGVGYAFEYSLSIAARSLTELSHIYEQILPMFNPTLRLTIDELDGLADPATITVFLNSTSLDLPSEIDNNSIRIVTSDLELTLIGTLYPPIKDSALIKQVRLHFKIWDTLTTSESQIPTSIQHKFDVDATDTHMQIPSTFVRTDFEQENTLGKNNPVILDLIGLDTLISNTDTEYKLIYTDADDERFSFVFNIINDTANTIIVSNDNRGKIITNSLLPGSFSISAQITDLLGNQSNEFQKDIIVQ